MVRLAELRQLRPGDQAVLGTGCYAASYLRLNRRLPPTLSKVVDPAQQADSSRRERVATPR